MTRLDEGAAHLQVVRGCTPVAPKRLTSKCHDQTIRVPHRRESLRQEGSKQHCSAPDRTARRQPGDVGAAEHVRGPGRWDGGASKFALTVGSTCLHLCVHAQAINQCVFVEVLNTCASAHASESLVSVRAWPSAFTRAPAIRPSTPSGRGPAHLHLGLRCGAVRRALRAQWARRRLGKRLPREGLEAETRGLAGCFLLSLT